MISIPSPSACTQTDLALSARTASGASEARLCHIADVLPLVLARHGISAEFEVASGTVSVAERARGTIDRANAERSIKRAGGQSVVQSRVSNRVHAKSVNRALADNGAQPPCRMALLDCITGIF